MPEAQRVSRNKLLKFHCRYNTITGIRHAHDSFNAYGENGKKSSCDMENIADPKPKLIFRVGI